MKRKYLANLLAMLGVAIFAAAVFRDAWFWGSSLGIYAMWRGYKLAGE